MDIRSSKEGIKNEVVIMNTLEGIISYNCCDAIMGLAVKISGNWL